MKVTVDNEHVTLTFDSNSLPELPPDLEHFSFDLINDYHAMAQILCNIFAAVIVNPALYPLFSRGLQGLTGMLAEENKQQMESGHGDI